MALDKNGLKQALKAIFEANGNDAESVATAMADAIDTYVKGAEVTVTALPSEVAVTSATFGPSANATALTFKGGDSTHVGGLS
jgi:hypothetical protein